MFISKLDVNGDFVWAKSNINEDGRNMKGFSIHIDRSQNIYLTGAFSGTQYLEFGQDTFNLKVHGRGATDVFILKLSQCPTTFDTMQINTCDSFTWIDGNTYTANTDTAKYILENAAGCDSIVTLDLTILHNDTVMHNITSCDQFILKNDTISNSGTYTFDTINVSGCDSTSIFNLTILKSTKEHIIVSACDSFLWKNNSFTETGIFFFDTINTAGCDSTIILDLTVNKKSDSLLQITACDSYFWHDSIITSSGIYRFDTLNTAGCDSSVSLNLTIVHTLESLDTLYICQGDTVSVFDSDFYGDTLISKTFVSSDGCDSIRYFRIITTPLPDSSILKSVCEGDSVFVIDRWLSEEGEYIIRKENSGDCDSIYHVFIEKRPVLSSFDTIFICKGDTISVFGFEVFDKSDLEQSFVGSNDCDSTVFVHVAVLEPVFSHSSITLCPGDSVFLNNQWVKSQGQYQEVFTGSNTCDSISNIDVTVLPKPDKPEIEINCEEATVLAKVSDSDDKDWNILWSNGDTSESTVFTGNEPAYVVFSAAPGCKIQYDFSIPLIPDLSLLPLINDTVIEAGTVLTYDIDLDTSQWAVLWTPSEIFDCNSCTSVKIQVKTTTEISLSMTHISGCTYQRVFIIDINERQLYIPDIFTPDGDGINDLWKIQSPYGIDIISCKIFDRWGELLYLSDKNIAWDGTFKGKNVSQGVYVYVIEYRDGSGEKHIVSGDITVVR
jgi:gliding motility-associated-like protein